MDEVIREAEEIFRVEWLHADFNSDKEEWELEIGGFGHDDDDPITYSFEANHKDLIIAKDILMEKLADWSSQ